MSAAERPPAARPHASVRDPDRLPSPASREGALLFLVLQLFLGILAVSRYDPTSFVFRGEETIDFFSWFWRRRWFGMFSFFDFLLAGMTVLAAATAVRRRRRVGRGIDLFVPFLAALVAVSVVVRSATQGPLDTRQDFLFQLRNYLYLGLSYLVVRQLRWDERRFRSIMKLLLALSAIVVVLFLFESIVLPAGFRVSKYGRMATVRDVADFTFVLFAQLWLIALALERFPRRWGSRIVLLVLIAYTFYSTFTGIGKAILVVYPAYLAYFFFHYRLYRNVVFMGPLLLGLFALAALVGYLARVNPAIEPSSPLYIYTTFTSDDPSVSTRRSELANFGENLSHRGGWLQGIGLGTKWFEYYDQPPDIGAYPESERGLPWHLGVHVPLVRLAYDFGVIGLALLLGFFGYRFFRSLRSLRFAWLQPSTRAFVQAGWLAIGYELFINNLGVPKGTLLVGVLLGCMRGLLDTAPVARRLAPAPPRATSTGPHPPQPA
jgi:hypothetical protein